MVRQAEADALDVQVRDLGGIEAQEVTFAPGVTVLVGRNATNRTSLLQAVAAALGGSIGELRGSADAGSVEIALDGDSYGRTFERTGDGRVRVDGAPYTDDDTLVDLFAALVEANPIRRAVERADGDELRELLMEPVDTEALADEIEATRRELESVRERLDEVDRQLGNLPALEQRREQKTATLADVESELESLREEVDDVEAALETASTAETESTAQPAARPDDGGGTAGARAPADHTDAESVLGELRSEREELEGVREERETQVEAVESLEADRSEIASELESLDVPDAEIADVEAELDGLQRRKRELATTISNLLSIVEFNEDLLDGDGTAATVGDAADVDPVEQLDPASRELECWTCGTAVQRRQIGERLDDLRAVVDEKREEQVAVERELEEQRSAIEDLRAHSDRRDELRARLSDVDDELERRRERVASLEERSSSLRDRIDELEAEAAEVESGGQDGRTAELVAKSRRLSELEYERGQLEASIERLDDEIASAEELSAERDRLEARSEELEADLSSLRGRVESLEAAAVETFNEHVETVVGRLDYENLERVWLERKVEGDAAHSGVDGGGPRDRPATFDLHVVRTADDGTVYEDTIDHLSESEREVVGLVVALAGYLVHDVHETVPVMLLDSLEAIDADRIAGLVAYLADYAPYLVVALLPGDAAALPDAYDRIEMGRD